MDNSASTFQGSQSSSSIKPAEGSRFEAKESACPSAADELLSAIRQVGRVKFYCSPSIAGRLKARRAKTTPGAVVVPKLPSLTRREQEVLELIARGQPNKQIAGNLGVSIKTVEKHRQTVMDKLGIHDIAGLTRYALDKGMLPSPASPQQPIAPPEH